MSPTPAWKFLLILKTLISCFSCFSSGLELKSGQWLTRSRIRWALSSCCFHVLMQIHLLSTRGSTLTHWSGLMPVIHPFISPNRSPVGSYEVMLESVPESLTKAGKTPVHQQSNVRKIQSSFTINTAWFCKHNNTNSLSNCYTTW